MPVSPFSLGRLLLTLGVAFTGVLAVVSPAAATTTFSITVTIAGDATVPQGTVNFWKAPFTQGGGNDLVGGTLTKDIPTDQEGDYKISVSLTNMDGATRWYKAGVPQGVTTKDDADILHLDGSAVPPLTIEFPQIAHLHGRVTNGDGTPAANVVVGRNRLGQGTSKQADADGYYDFGYVQPGTTTVSVNGAGNWGRAQQTLVMPTSGDVEINLVRPELARISGTVTDATTGDPIQHLTVTAYVQANVGYATSATTDASGHYTLEGLGAGPFIVKYDDPLISYGTHWNGGVLTSGEAAPIAVVAGATTTHDEALTARPDPRSSPHTIGGLVTDSQGHPLPDIEVFLYDPASPAFPIANAATDRLGRWGQLATPGDYLVGFSQGAGNGTIFPSPTEWYSEFYPDAWGREDAGVVTIPMDSSNFGIDAQLVRSAHLTLSATDSTGSTDLNVGYQLLSLAGAPVLEHQPLAGDGNQAYLSLKPGTYKMLILGRRGYADNSTSLVPRWLGGGNSLTTASKVTFVPGGMLNAPVVLPRALKATTKPAVSGTPKPGKRLKVSSGVWNQMTGTTFTYQWLRGTKVVGTKKAYLVTKADAGKTLIAKVTAANGTLSTTTKSAITIRR